MAANSIEGNVNAVFYDSISDQYFRSVIEFLEYKKEYKEKYGEYPSTQLYPTKPVYMPSLGFDVDEWASCCGYFPGGERNLFDCIPKDHPILEKLETLKKLIEEIENEEVILDIVQPDYTNRLSSL